MYIGVGICQNERGKRVIGSVAVDTVVSLPMDTALATLANSLVRVT